MLDIIYDPSESVVTEKLYNIYTKGKHRIHLGEMSEYQSKNYHIDTNLDNETGDNYSFLKNLDHDADVFVDNIDRLDDKELIAIKELSELKHLHFYVSLVDLTAKNIKLVL